MVDKTYIIIYAVVEGGVKIWKKRYVNGKRENGSF